MATLRFRVSDEIAEQFKSLAAHGQQTPSEVLRSMIEAVLKRSPTPVTPADPARLAQKARVSVRLRGDVFDRAQELAAAEQRPVSQWVAALIAARVGACVPFNDAELRVLREAVNEVARVGRNLNTLLHVLHRSGQGDAGSVRVEELHSAVRGALAQVRAIREQALGRYGQAGDED